MRAVMHVRYTAVALFIDMFRFQHKLSDFNIMSNLSAPLK